MCFYFGFFSVSPDRQEQLHELLACDARYKWADMSKVSKIYIYKQTQKDSLLDAKGRTNLSLSHQVLCEFDTNGRGWIHKKSLRELLFTYALPMRSDEFDQFWSR